MTDRKPRFTQTAVAIVQFDWSLIDAIGSPNRNKTDLFRCHRLVDQLVTPLADFRDLFRPLTCMFLRTSGRARATQGKLPLRCPTRARLRGNSGGPRVPNTKVNLAVSVVVMNDGS